MKRRVVVAGATGTIGRALTARLHEQGRQVIGISRTASAPGHVRLDLTSSSSSWPRWPATDVTFVCIGAGGLEACERDPAGTRRVNVDAVAALARHATAAGSSVVLVSSAHVFDGTKPVAHATDPRQPQTAYGRQKEEAELAVLEQRGAAVLRCSKIIGRGDTRLTAWRHALLAGRSIEAFDDLPVAPLSIADVVTALEKIGDAGQSGIFQLSGFETTYFAMALALARHLDVDRSLVRRASAEAAGMPAAFRPRGVRLEQALPFPFEVTPLDVAIAHALESRL